MAHAPQVSVMRTGGSDRQLRWMSWRSGSIRSYAVSAGGGPRFCVSTRSSELTLLLEGEAWIEVGPARQQYRLLPDQGCVVLRGTPHGMAVTADARFLIIDLARDLSEGQASPDRGGLIHLPSLPPGLTRVIPELWDQRLHAARGELERWIEALALHALPRIAVEPAHNTRRMLAVKAALDRHYAAPINLQALARRHGMDRYYLVRAFRHNFGAPPSTYIQFLRLEHFAWSLLRGGGEEITRCACEAGYGDYSTFCRRIRQAFGRPPSELVQRVAL